MKVSIVSFSYPRGVPEDTDDEVSLRGYSALFTTV